MLQCSYGGKRQAVEYYRGTYVTHTTCDSALAGLVRLYQMTRASAVTVISLVDVHSRCARF